MPAYRVTLNPASANQRFNDIDTYIVVAANEAAARAAVKAHVSNDADGAWDIATVTDLDAAGADGVRMACKFVA